MPHDARQRFGTETKGYIRQIGGELQIHIECGVWHATAQCQSKGPRKLRSSRKTPNFVLRSLANSARDFACGLQLGSCLAHARTTARVNVLAADDEFSYWLPATAKSKPPDAALRQQTS